MFKTMMPQIRMLIIFLLSFLDTILTVGGLMLGYQEMNPIYEYVGGVGFILIKLIFCIIMFCIYYYLDLMTFQVVYDTKFKRYAFYWMTNFIIFLLISAFIWNMYQLMR